MKTLSYGLSGTSAWWKNVAKKEIQTQKDQQNIDWYKSWPLSIFISNQVKPSTRHRRKMYRTASCKKKKKNIGILTSEFIKVNYLTTLSLDVCTVCVDQSNIWPTYYGKQYYCILYKLVSLIDCQVLNTKLSFWGNWDNSKLQIRELSQNVELKLKESHLSNIMLCVCVCKSLVWLIGLSRGSSVSSWATQVIRAPHCHVMLVTSDPC